MRDELLGQAGCGSFQRLVHWLWAALVSLLLLPCLADSLWGAEKPQPPSRNIRILVKPQGGLSIAALHATAKERLCVL